MILGNRVKPNVGDLKRVSMGIMEKPDPGPLGMDPNGPDPCAGWRTEYSLLMGCALLPGYRFCLFPNAGYQKRTIFLKPVVKSAISLLSYELFRVYFSTVFFCNRLSC